MATSYGLPYMAKHYDDITTLLFHDSASTAHATSSKDMHSW